MTGFSNGIVDAQLERFVEVYQDLRREAGERILSRSNLPLKAVHPFADTLTVVDISVPDFWLVRLSGTKSCERIGMDNTGGNAQSRYSGEDLTLRKQLVSKLFEYPCGIRATTRETYVTGAHALLGTITLPMLGEEAQPLVVHYAGVIKDIAHEYKSRPPAEKSEIVSYEFIDLGHGTPANEPALLSA